jgi:hypothetical protein
MAMFNKTKSPDELAEQERRHAHKELEKAQRETEKERQRAEKDREKAERQARREHEAFLGTPVGQARTAFERGDDLFQYAHDVESQDAVIVSMVGSTTSRRSSDPTEILNAVAREGWELVNGSFIFREQGQQSRDKFMSSGQNVAIKGTTVGYYLFRRAEEHQHRAEDALQLTAGSSS